MYKAQWQYIMNDSGMSELMQYRNKDADENNYEAARLSAGKLKLMCSIGSDRCEDELLCRRAHRGHGTSFVLQ